MSMVTQRINKIESEVFRTIKPLGFTKHGRTLHRFVDGDLSQVIEFQCGPAYRKATHLMWVNIGIRIPECVERQFHAVNDRDFYHEYECNMRSRLGTIAAKDCRGEKTFQLDGAVEVLCREILDEIETEVLPVFDLLSNRCAVLEHRREYPYFDTMNNHLIKLEESMIYGHLGDFSKSRERFEEYYETARQNCRRCTGHVEYLDELRCTLGFQ